MAERQLLKRSLKLTLTASLAGSVLMTTACGVGGNGVGRNPLGGNARLTNTQSPSDKPGRIFNGDPEKLRSLFLRPLSKGQMLVGETFPWKSLPLMTMAI